MEVHSTVKTGYLLKHKDHGYYSKYQPDYFYSWTHDLGKAKIFQTVDPDSIGHYLTYTNWNEGVGTCVIITCEVSTSVVLVGPLLDDTNPLMVEYNELLSKVEEYDDVEKVPNKVWKKFKSLRTSLINMGLLPEVPYKHRVV